MHTDQNGARRIDYAAIEVNVSTWLSTRPNIRAAVVIGSHSRGTTYGADDSSDYDLLLVTTDPAGYQQTDWLSVFGPVVSAVFDPHDHVAFAYSLDFFTVYEGGRNVDISVLPYDYVQRLIHDPVAREKDFVHLITPMFAHGVRVLVDPEQIVAQLAAVFPLGSTAFVPPTEAAFAQAVEDFWQRVVRIPKNVQAGPSPRCHTLATRPNAGPYAAGGVAWATHPQPAYVHVVSGQIPRTMGRSPRCGSAPPPLHRRTHTTWRSFYGPLFFGERRMPESHGSTPGT